MNIKGLLLAINCYFILPVVCAFTGGWFLFGTLSESETKYWLILISCLLYIVISIFLGFKYVYKIAASNSDSKDKKIFIIGITILIITLIIFFKIYFKR